MPGDVHWRHVAAFLGLTFGLTFLLDLAVYIRGGLTPLSISIVQFQMLLPAFSAVLLCWRFFAESPLHHSRSLGRPRLFYHFFLLATLLSGVGVLASWLSPDSAPVRIVAATLPVALSVIGLILLIVLRFVAGREAMEHAWLGFGKWRDWVLFGVGVVVFYVVQAALNAASGLGGAQLTPLPAVPGLSPNLVLLLGGIQTVVLGPFLGLVLGLGEEFGWRGYLQNELFQLGRVRGVVVVGIVWGMWHWPLIMMGFNYPGYPLFGLLLMALYTTGLAVVLGYAVLRSGSIVLAAYLHALNDQVAAFLIALGFRPHDPAFSFFIGVYGIATLSLVALVLLRDPRWRLAAGNPTSPTD